MWPSSHRLLLPIGIVLSVSICLDAFSLLSIRYTTRHDTLLPRLHRSSIHVQMTKSKNASTNNRKKKKSSPNLSGLKGFGSSSFSYSTGAVDRSKSALDFYQYLQKNGGASNLKRVGLGRFPISQSSSPAESATTAATTSTIRGVIALRDISKGESILEIPYEMALDFGRESADPTLPATSLLQMYCQWKTGSDERNRSKRDHGEYFSMLPPYLSLDCLGSTDFFSDVALDMMQSPFIKEETLRRRELVKERYERDVQTMAEMSANLYRWIDSNYQNDDESESASIERNHDPVVPRENCSDIVTISHLQWATWLITSRVLTVQGSPDESVAHRLLIPLIDMCNHDRDSPHILTGRAMSGGMLKVIAGADVKAGEAIDIAYGGGVEGNDRFIQDYGFLDTGGSVERRNSEGGSHSFVGVEAYNIVAKRLLGKQSFFRGVDGVSRRISLIDQQRALEALQATTLEEDEVLLASGKIVEYDERIALQYRIGVKRALELLMR